jgi:RNA polymerase sigma-70 factor (family 1)
MTQFSETADAELLNRLKGGDKFAYLKMYDHYAPVLLNYAASRLTDVNDAADLVHDVFLQVWLSREQIKEIKPYLYTLLRNRIIDYVRKNSVRTVYANMLQALESEPEYNMENKLEAKEMQSIIDQAISELPERTREIFKLNRIEGLSIKQIAELLNISEQTVKNQLGNAKNQLRKVTKGFSLLVILYLFY